VHGDENTYGIGQGAPRGVPLHRSAPFQVRRGERFQTYVLQLSSACDVRCATEYTYSCLIFPQFSEAFQFVTYIPDSNNYEWYYVLWPLTVSFTSLPQLRYSTGQTVQEHEACCRSICPKGARYVQLHFKRRRKLSPIRFLVPAVFKSDSFAAPSTRNPKP